MNPIKKFANGDKNKKTIRGLSAYNSLMSNYSPLLAYINSKQLYIQQIETQLNRVELQDYHSLILLNPKRLISQADISHTQQAVLGGHTNLVVFSDAYTTTNLLIDANIRQKPPSNIYSLNEILKIFGIEFGYDSMSGEANILKQKIKYKRGTYIREFPVNNYLFFADLITDTPASSKIGAILPRLSEKQAVLGLYDNIQDKSLKGKIAVWGDSTCLRISANNCLGLLDTMELFFGGSLSTLKDYKTTQNYVAKNQESYKKAVDEQRQYFMGDESSADKSTDPNNVVLDKPQESKIVNSTDANVINIDALVIICLIALVSISVAVYVLRCKKQRRFERCMNQNRLPKYSVIYI